MTAKPPLTRRRLVDVVIDHLRTEISTGRLVSGARLPPETKLTAELGVSRTTLREAIVVLSHDGLVDVRHGNGTYVKAGPGLDKHLAGRSMPELLETKRALELELVRLAANRRTAEDADSLQKLTAELTAALDSKNLDGARHAALAIERAIGAAAKSRLLAELARQVSSAVDSASSEEAQRLPQSLEMLGQLAQAAQGVIDHNAESADRHLRLWLAAQESLLSPNKAGIEYSSPAVRRGPRTSHASTRTGTQDQ